MANSTMDEATRERCREVLDMEMNRGTNIVGFIYCEFDKLGIIWGTRNAEMRKRLEERLLQSLTFGLREAVRRLQ